MSADKRQKMSMLLRRPLVVVANYEVGILRSGSTGWDGDAHNLTAFASAVNHARLTNGPGEAQIIFNAQLTPKSECEEKRRDEIEKLYADTTAVLDALIMSTEKFQLLLKSAGNNTHVLFITLTNEE